MVSVVEQQLVWWAGQATRTPGRCGRSPATGSTPVSEGDPVAVMKSVWVGGWVGRLERLDNTCH